MPTLPAVLSSPVWWTVASVGTNEILASPTVGTDVLKALILVCQQTQTVKIAYLTM